MCLQFGFVIIWQKDFGAKAAHKMLVKLTLVRRLFCQKNALKTSCDTLRENFIYKVTKVMTGYHEMRKTIDTKTQ